jgi:hypothetical protein
MHARACAGTDVKRSAEIYSAMKLPVVGGLTQAEGVALGAFVSTDKECMAVPDCDLGIHGVLLENGALHLHSMHVAVNWRSAVSLLKRAHCPCARMHATHHLHALSAAGGAQVLHNASVMHAAAQ